MVEKARAAAVDPKNLPISTGSLNGLVEWLIWKFLNEPGELLAPTPTPKAKTGDGSE
jgi:hypothetical protein